MDSDGDNNPNDLDEYLQRAGLQSFYLYRCIRKWHLFIVRIRRQQRIQQIYQTYQLRKYLHVWRNTAKLSHRQRLVQGLLERKRLQTVWLQWRRMYRTLTVYRRLETLRQNQLRYIYIHHWRLQTKRVSRTYTQSVLARLNTLRESHQLSEALTLWYTKIHNPSVYSLLTRLSLHDRYGIRLILQRWRKHCQYRKELRASVYLLRQRTNASHLQRIFIRWKQYVINTQQTETVHDYLARSFYDRYLLRHYFRTWIQHQHEEYRNRLIRYEREQLIPRVRYYIGIWYNILRKKQRYRKAVHDSELYARYRIIGTYFQIWKRNINHLQYLRKQGLRALQYYQSKLRYETFQAWKRYHYLKQQKYRNYSKSIQFFLRTRTPSVLQRWREYTRDRRNLFRAREVYSQKLIRTLFIRWKYNSDYRRQLQYRQSLVRSNRTYTQQHQFIQQWYRYTQQQKGIRAIKIHQNQRLLGCIVRAWSRYTRTDQYFSRSIDHWQQNQRIRTLHRVVNHFRNYARYLIHKEKEETTLTIRPFRQRWTTLHLHQRLHQWLHRTRANHRLQLIESRIRYKHQLYLMKHVCHTLQYYRHYRKRKYELEQAADRFLAVSIAWKTWKQWTNVYHYRQHLRKCYETIVQRRHYYYMLDRFRQWKHYVKYRKELGLLYLSGLHLRSILSLPILSSSSSSTSTDTVDGSIEDNATNSKDNNHGTTNEKYSTKTLHYPLSQSSGHPPGSEQDTISGDTYHHITNEKTIVSASVPHSTTIPSVDPTTLLHSSWNYIDSLLHTMETQLELHKQEYLASLASVRIQDSNHVHPANSAGISEVVPVEKN